MGAVLDRPQSLSEIVDDILGIASREREPYLFRNFPALIPDESGGFAPIPMGSAEEITEPLGSMPFTWGTVSTTPNFQRLQLTGKALLTHITLRIAGTWDQSVGAETQATEGNVALWDQIRLSLDGRTYRAIPGAVLFETNKIKNAAAGPKVDPATGIASGKAFSATLFYDMGFVDASEPDVREHTYLDLSQYANAFLEIQPGPFNRYVSGSTQANMTATITASAHFVIGPRRIPQSHSEFLLSNVVDMNVTGNDRSFNLTFNRLLLRGLLLRCGALSGTPVVTATTALSQLGIKGKLSKGSFFEPKVKQATGFYQSEVSNNRNGLALTAGYVWLDFATNRKLSSMLIGKTLADLNLIIDSAAQAGHSLQVYQLVQTR